MTREEPVYFKNRSGREIYGIAHIPVVYRTERKFGVIFLNPGPGYRIAHHRLYVKLGRKLVQKGLYILRFDPSGLGESEGDIEETMLFDLFTSINKGRFIHDTVDAAEFFISRYGLEGLIFVGLCGGAMTALLATPHCKRVCSLILLGFPVLFNSLDAEKKATTPLYARDRLKRSLANFKQGNLNSWQDLLRKAKNCELGRSIAQILVTSVRAMRKDQLKLHPNFNQAFWDTFKKIKKDIDINFIFGENDRWKFYFEVEFEQKLARVAEKENYKKIVIKNANHLFTLRKSQMDLMQVIECIINDTCCGRGNQDESRFNISFQESKEYLF